MCLLSGPCLLLPIRQEWPGVHGLPEVGTVTPADGADLHMDLLARCALAERGGFLSGMFQS